MSWRATRMYSASEEYPKTTPRQSLGMLGYSTRETVFLHCDEFPHMLQKWRDSFRGAGTKAARDALDSWSVSNVKLLINQEMQQLAPYMCSPQKELTEEGLLSIKLTNLATQIQTTAAILYQILHSLSSNPKQLSL
ncbi:hypothetical protein BC835DRAFT_1306757 [Cytidiella melzeri]|nr:hypothetical protein BC835DRAFT_1306757 [Cytidiella melzeri]